MQCKGCKKEIVFLKTQNDKEIPVDASSLTEEDWTIIRNTPNRNKPILYFRYGEHISHFATCSFADIFRKKK